LEKLEAVYKSSHYVQNLCVYAHSEYSFVVIVVQPIFAALHAFVKQSDINVGENVDLSDLVKLEELKKEVRRDLADIGKKAGFKGGEILGGLVFASEEWTPTNGYLVCIYQFDLSVDCGNEDQQDVCSQRVY